MKKKEWFFITSAYLILALFMFWSLIPHFNTGIIGGGGDANQFIWSFWHFKHDIFAGINPFLTNAIFYPLHISLLLHTTTPIKSILSIPLQLVFNLLTTYNILILYTFIASALGMYLLIESVFKNKFAAFIGGFVFAFAPNQMAHALGHFNVISIEAIPWLIFVWKKHQESPSKWKVALLSGLAAYLFLCDYQLFFYMSFLTVIYLAFMLKVSFQKAKEKALQLLLVFSGFLVLLLPFWIMALSHINNFNIMALHDPGWAPAKVYCADLLSLFIPSELHPWWGSIATKIYASFQHHELQGVGYSNAAERSLSFGLVVLGGMIFGVIKYWREKFVRFWFWAGLVFFILALGPVLYFAGFSLNFFPELRFKILFPMPYMLIHVLPIINGMRIPGRFILMTILSGTMIFSFVLVKISENRNIPSVMKKTLFIIISVLIFIEYLPPNYPVIEIRIPQIYNLIKVDLNNNNVVLDLPSAPWVNQLTSLVNQTYHEHKLIGGWMTARVSKSQAEYIEKYKIIKQLSEMDPKANVGDFKTALDELGVVYIVVRGINQIEYFNKISREIPGLEVLEDFTGPEQTKLWKVARPQVTPMKN